uniref:Uncharacterized protein n=1 Tax=viral metagenome TaxID=1070528 RepID=A0A6C0B942_9ZZZZ
MDEKKIIIQGTSNRYQMKKLIHEKKEPTVRKECKQWNISPEVYTDLYQVTLINELYNFYASINKSTEKKVLSTEANLAKREIEKKRQSYKQQDIYKNRFSESEFINFFEIVAKLYESKLTCAYCNSLVYIMYEYARESNQWTLDRLNNDIAHNDSNVIISCLQCNLKRRRTNKDAFLFTKKMQLIKTSLG